MKGQPITQHGPKITMQFDNIVKSEIDNMWGIMSSVVSNEMFHFGKSANNFHDWVFVMEDLGNPTIYEV